MDQANEDDSGEYYYGICSRNEEKKPDQSYVDKYKDVKGNLYHKYIDPETKVKGWFCDDTLSFKTEEDLLDSGAEPIKIEVKDSWVELAHKSGLVERGLEYCKRYNVELALRGEIIGQGLKGSGNKFNPDSQSKQALVLFGVDDLSSGFSTRLHYGNAHNLRSFCDDTNTVCTEVYTVIPSSYEELCAACDKIIKSEKTQGRVIEGVVVRTKYSNDVSCKYMNPEYDAKK
jgi:hypothetical protein